MAIRISSRGFAWVLFESPLSLVDSGLAYAKPGRHGRLLHRLDKLIDRYEPAVLVLEEFEGKNVRRAKRIQALYRGMAQLADTRGVYVPRYSWEAVRLCFSRFGVRTRYDIAQVIARTIDALRRKLPSKRKIWVGECARQSIFDAAALALTYFTAQGEP